MKYRYRGGPLDGEQVETPVGASGPYDVVHAPKPLHNYTPEQANEPAHVDYYRTLLPNGEYEYWTADYRDARAAEQQPVEVKVRQLEQRTAALEAQVEAAARELEALNERVTRALEVNNLWDGS